MKSIGVRLTEPGGVATRLRGLRIQAGMTGKGLATELGWQPSKVSRIETGQQPPSAADVRAWASACSLDHGLGDELVAALQTLTTEHATWRRQMRHGQAIVQSGERARLTSASYMRNFETALVPGLLQTPGYARRVLAEMVELHDLDVQDIDAAVAARMQRQQALYEEGKTFEFLVAEPVLWWGLCSPEAMRIQLDRLQTAIGLSQIRFGIVPFGRRIATIPQGPFAIYDGPVAVVETFVGETTYRGAEAVMYEQMMDRLWADAVEGDAARKLIVAAARRL